MGARHLDAYASNHSLGLVSLGAGVGRGMTATLACSRAPHLLEDDMTFGTALELMLRRTGYVLVSEFVTPDRRLAVRMRELKTSTVVAMYHSDAIELARGGATVAAIVHRNRSVFPPSTVARESVASVRPR